METDVHNRFAARPRPGDQVQQQTSSRRDHYRIGYRCAIPLRLETFSPPAREQLQSRGGIVPSATQLLRRHMEHKDWQLHVQHVPRREQRGEGAEEQGVGCRSPERD